MRSRTFECFHTDMQALYKKNNIFLLCGGLLTDIIIKDIYREKKGLKQWNSHS
ncbi:hypothetical protein HMPREF7545_1197 [Selenomonas noxia ATCC 43541]|nr:hypothetical protein HMPREF7545_1197 [Selenomonas noxia ATCC 43541]